VRATALPRNRPVQPSKVPSVPVKPKVVAHARSLPLKRPATVQSVGELPAVRNDDGHWKEF